VCSPTLAEEAARSESARLRAATVTTGALAELTPTPFSAPPVAPDDVAFLQLTSGSTGVPRAVMVTHRGAIHNPLAIHEATSAPFGVPLHEWGVSAPSWLPLYHDMGLIGSLFSGLLCGTELWLMTPRTFLGRPAAWLKNLGAFPCTVAPAPNFAFQACVERVTADDLAGVDLSGWRAAMIGAEMINAETIEAFTRTFAPCGFSPRTFRACYGLAEGTLAITFDRHGEGVRFRAMAQELGEGTVQIASVGAPVMDTEVRICAPDGTPLPDGMIGEVRASGPGIFAGYYRDPESTAEALRDGWLCTGDLGMQGGGELWITGRTKDLIIVNGQNVMPHEIEWLAEAVTGGGGAARAGAFSLPAAGGEKPVLVVEVLDGATVTLGALDRDIRARVGRALGVPLADLVFVRRGRIPKTTSGKVQRRELRRRYLAHEIERLALDEGPA
jgi:acyl-CoA synthetase (AMP-forming)/AMP-acid ligase II